MELNKNIFNLVKQQKFKDVLDLINSSKNIDINIRDNSSTYLIQYAIMYSNIELILKLLELDCKLDYINSDGFSILYFPIKHGLNNIVEILLKYNKVVGIPLTDIIDKYGSLPIHYTLYYDNNVAFDLLISSIYQINKLDNKGMSPLHIAIKKKNYYAIDKLLDYQNININIQSNIGETPLHIACNYEDINIIKKLVNNKDLLIDIIDYEYQISPLMYIVTLGNIDIVKILLENNSNLEIQDMLGNTSLHLAINENNIQIGNILISRMTNFNLTDINGMTPLHKILNMYNDDISKIKKYNIDLLLTNTNLNIQDMNGNTIWHIFSETGIWYFYKDILKSKKNNLFIKNCKNISPFDLLKNSKYFDILLDVIISSYYFLLITRQHEYLSKLDNDCSIKNLSKDECYIKIKDIILNNNISIPLKKNNYSSIVIDIGINTIFTTFTGVPIDILSGLLLLHKNNNIMSTLNNLDLITNNELKKYYLQLGIIKSNIDFLNFEIIWLYQNIFFPDNFESIILKFINNPDINFFIIPIGIELDAGAHANILIYDKLNNILERFEPNGSDPPPSFNYNSNLFDNILYGYFKKIFPNLKYLTPKMYLPKIGFQGYENFELYKTRKLGDPGGFCVVWCLWYANNKIKYNNISSEKLVEILIKKIKYDNLSFKNIIRNYSKYITDYRDSILDYVDIDINSYLNNQYNEEILNKIQFFVQNNV